METCLGGEIELGHGSDQRDDIHVPVRLHRPVQGGELIGVPNVHVNTGGNEVRHQHGRFRGRRGVKKIPSVDIENMTIRPAFDQRLDHVQLAVLAAIIQDAVLRPGRFLGIEICVEVRQRLDENGGECSLAG